MCASERTTGVHNHDGEGDDGEEALERKRAGGGLG